MRAVVAVLIVASSISFVPSTSASAQTRDQITGKTCKQLFRSCFRICVRHKGEPGWRGCEADCNAGNKACRSNLTWTSKNATITVERRK